MAMRVPTHASSVVIHVLFLELLFASCLGLSAPSSSTDVPSWPELSKAILPSTPPPPTIDCFVEARRNPGANIDATVKSKIHPSLPTLYRERNGWCVHSARLWLALEAKGVRYNTVLVEARGDTYDGSPTLEEQQGTDGRPERLAGLDLPQLCLISGEDNSDLLSGAGDEACTSLLQSLDELFPGAFPLWPPINNYDALGCTSSDISAATRAFMDTAPESDVCRQSSRAAWLFCSEEGYRLDPLSRQTFEKVLDDTDNLLGKSVGPFFAGNIFSAADVFWSPLLERYSAQLPCLHKDLIVKGNSVRWPHINEWYDAMNNVPAYACRIRGDGPSWRKVLYREPWWPSEETWHPRDTVGPKGELKASEDEVVSMFGDTNAEDCVWESYVKSHPHVASSSTNEAAACLVRNHEQITFDMIKWSSEWGYEEYSSHDVDKELRFITHSLSISNDDNTDEMEAQAQLHNESIAPIILEYLQDRMCIPRDMGAPSASKLQRILKTITHFAT